MNRVEGEVLDEAECAALLARTENGRVAVTLGALPAILPVTYRLVDGDVMFFTGDDPKLLAALSETVVAFEVDWADPLSQAAWSVHVVGIARVSDSAADRSAAMRAGLSERVQGRGSHLVTIRAAHLSGRSSAGASPPS